MGGTEAKNNNFVSTIYKKIKRLIYLNVVARFKTEFHNGAAVQEPEWSAIHSEKYIKRSGRKTDVSVRGNVPSDVSLPNKSRAVDFMIMELSGSDKYSFADMLVLINPYQNAQLCAVAVFGTDLVCSVHVKVCGKTEDASVEYDLPKSLRHVVPLLGLYPGYKNKVEISIINEKRRKKTHYIDIDIGKLPGEQSEIDVRHTMDSGSKYLYDMTLVYGGDGKETPYAFDRNTDIRFSCSLLPKSYGFQPLSGGRFLYQYKKFCRFTCTNPSSVKLLIVDQLGRTDNILYVDRGVHHDFQELPNGDYVMGSNSVEDGMFEDSVAIIDHITGKIIRQIDLPPMFPEEYAGNTDWAHLNSVQYFPDKNELLVSLRNLHSLVMVDCNKEEIKWILCAPQFWKGSGIEDKVLKPVGDCSWFFQQHAGYVINNLNDKLNIILYDNHRAARVPVDYFDDDGMSHIMFFEIDEEKMTCRQLKSFPVDMSVIRSNAIYDTELHKGFVKSDRFSETETSENGKVISMSGTLEKQPVFKWKDSGRDSIEKRIYKGEVLQLDYATGKLEHCFMTTNAYYRAYGMSFEPYALVKRFYKHNSKDSALDCSDYVLGGISEMNAISHEEGKKILKSSVQIKKKNTNIRLRVEENYLQIKMIDHQLKQLYLIGEKHAYAKDYSDTVQERDVFRTMKVYDTVPLESMADDDYTVHFCDGERLFNLGYKIKVSRKSQAKDPA